MFIDKLKTMIYGSKGKRTTEHRESSFVKTTTKDNGHRYVVVLKDNAFHLHFTTPGGSVVTDELRKDEFYHLVDISPTPSLDQYETIVRMVREWLPNAYVSMRINNDSSD